MDEFAQFQKTFFQECDELLAGYEEIVSRLDEAGAVREDLDAMFRAAHSIKAGAGAFGFTRMVRYTHEFENALERLRSGVIDLPTFGRDLLVEAGDVLFELVRAARCGVEAREGLEDAALARFASLGAQTVASPVKPTETRGGDFLVRFRPHRALYESANDPQLLLRALAALGACEISVDVSAVPGLSHIDPSEAYLAFSIQLRGARGEAAIREIFEFVEDECDLTIEPLTDSPAASAPISNVRVAQEDLAAPTESPAASAQVAPAQPASIRVDLDRVDRLVDMVGELVIAQSVALEQVSKMLSLENVDQIDALHDLTLRARQLQEGVMAIRMQPLKVLFARYPRIVRDLTKKLGKAARLEMVGEATEVDKTIIEELADPLTHMIRNSIDHGIEDPEARRAARKPAEAVITLSAEQRNGRILIRVRDDGRGLDPNRILQKAIDKGLVPADANLSREEMEALIFLPGFSTASEVSDLSGRGVGMDVVRRNIQKLGGRVSVESRLGAGATFTITLPLTLAVLDGMLIAAGGERYIVPLSAIIETICPRPADMRRIPEGGEALNVRGEVIRLVDVAGVLGRRGEENLQGRRLVVCCESEFGKKVGLVVDQLLGQQQVVVKSIEANYQAIEGVSGTAILGDGRVRLILDIDGLVSLAARKDRVAYAAARRVQDSYCEEKVA